MRKGEKKHVKVHRPVMFTKCLIGQWCEKYQDIPSSVRDKLSHFAQTTAKRALALSISKRLNLGVLL